MPTATDLVTDLPADFEVFGQAVATSMADLLGGTTGQILSKATNTDMDFVWIANDQGDITGVTATSPLTGGGTSGAITVGIQDALTTQKGAVQLSDSTSTTSSILAATPTAVKSAYDLANTANTAAGTAQTTANAAIPKSTVTTAGDIIYGTGAGAVTRLGVGSTGQVLTVAAGVPSWATASSGSSFAGCRLNKVSGSQSIADSTYVAVTWPTEVFDVGGYHDTTTNTSRITIPSGKGGYYRVSWRQGVTAAASTCTIYTNGTGGTRNAFVNVANAEANGSTMVLYLAAGDYIEVYLRQTSGTAKVAFDENNGAAGFIWFDCNYLGA